jgi:hypothetical protein
MTETKQKELLDLAVRLNTRLDSGIAGGDERMRLFSDYELVKGKLSKVYGPLLRRLVAAGLMTVVLDEEKEVIRQALDAVPADEKRLQVLLDISDVEPDEPFSLLSCCVIWTDKDGEPKIGTKPRSAEKRRRPAPRN